MSSQSGVVAVAQLWRRPSEARGARVSAGAIGGLEVSTRGVVEEGIGGGTFERATAMMNDRYR